MVDINLTLQQQMQCRRCMCQQRCRQMLYFNCINVDKLILSEQQCIIE